MNKRRKVNGLSVFTGNKNLRVYSSIQSFSGKVSHTSTIQKPKDLRRHKALPRRAAAENIVAESSRAVSASYEEVDTGATSIDLGVGDSIREADAAGEWIDEEVVGEIRDGIYEIGQSDTHGYQKYKDHRTRRDRTENLTRQFEAQIEAVTDSYLRYEHETASRSSEKPSEQSPTSSSEGRYTVRVVDIYDNYEASVTFSGEDHFIVSALASRGFIASSPITPTLCFTTRCLELYRVASSRTPQLAKQGWVKTLCDYQQVAYRGTLVSQFTIAFDVYLSVRRAADRRVQAALGRDKPNWRMENACPACTNKQPREPLMKHKIFVTIDGNESLKRFQRRKAAPDYVEHSLVEMGDSVERVDSRNGRGDYILQPDVVNRLAQKTETFVQDSEVDKSPCEDRWKNMSEVSTGKMWGIFEETGIFLSLCRHGFVLVAADMIRSGEQSKYALAVVQKLLDVFGEDLGIGYDIGCQFASTLRNSPLGELAEALNTEMMVGEFHGHAHNRLCQLSRLGLYQAGRGLEPLEFCETFFSKSNRLAGTTRYATAFHRHQAITEYFRHTDTMETYANLSHLLCSHYRRAMVFIDGKDVVLQTLRNLEIADGQPEEWLDEERRWLESRQHEPAQETLAMEYVLALKAYNKASDALQAAKSSWDVLQPADFMTAIPTTARSKAEKARRHALENHDKQMKLVQEIELKLADAVTERWTPESDEWVHAEQLLSRREFQQALDHLEGLILARLFELTKVHQSQTGYKLREHIGKAMQRRSATIRAALDRYNNARLRLPLQGRPPQLQWSDVASYAFLAEFDLLRDTREDIRQKPWTKPAVREAMTQYFKIQRSREEIERLNIEIPRVIAYMRDEDEYLASMVLKVQVSDPSLAYQIELRRRSVARYTPIHTERFNRLHKEVMSKGTVGAGWSMPRSSPDLTRNADRLTNVEDDKEVSTEHNIKNDDNDDDSDDENDDEELEEEEMKATEGVLAATAD